MADTFTVFYLGNQTDIDTTEGNTQAENASALVGSTFGSEGDEIFNQAQTFSPGDTGYSGGTSSAYDQDNSPAETFKIDGGADQTFDSSAVYNATITYTDGSTANITAVVFQDTDGNSYWAPEYSYNADQAAMEAAPIESISLDSVAGSNYSGMTGSRQSWDFQTCFAEGTRLRTPGGEVPVEDLRQGDLLVTEDSGALPVLWISTCRPGAAGDRPAVRIAAGALGRGLPRADLTVTRQHRMLVTSKIARRMFGLRDVLVPAIRLAGLPGIAEVGGTRTRYYHVLLDPHSIIFANGAPTESLFLGPRLRETMQKDELALLRRRYPQVFATAPEPARPIEDGRRARRLFERHCRNARPVLADA